MLILTRKAGESIRIGEDIEVVVTVIEPGKVKIGVKSPSHIPIYREELYQRIQRDNRNAAGMKPADLDSMLLMVANGKEPAPSRNKDAEEAK